MACISSQPPLGHGDPHDDADRLDREDYQAAERHQDRFHHVLGEADADGLTDADADGLTERLGDALTLDEGLTDADADRDALEDGDTDGLGELLGDTLALGDTLGLTDELGPSVTTDTD